MKRLFVDMDGTLNEWGHIDSVEELYEKGYFLNRPPHQNVIDAVYDIVLNDNKMEVYTLSCYLTDSQFALSEKQKWLDKHIPVIDSEHQIFVPFGTNKAEFLKEEYGITLSPNDFLLDDYTQNLKEWKEYGGTGIKLVNNVNNSYGTWEGKKVYYEQNNQVLSADISSYIRNSGFQERENHYFDEDLDINGTANELYSQAANNYIEEPAALLFVKDVLETEGKVYHDRSKLEKAERVGYMHDRETEDPDKIKIAQAKLDFMDGLYCAYDEVEYGNDTKLSLVCEQDTVIASLTEMTVDDNGNDVYGIGAASLPLDEFKNMNQSDFERLVGNVYAYNMEYTVSEAEKPDNSKNKKKSKQDFERD